MNEMQRKYQVYRLTVSLDLMSRSDDWEQRNILVTRIMGILRNIGLDKDTFWSMDSEYLLSEYSNSRKYKDRLCDIVDMNNQKMREDAVFEFYVWLHEIRLLHEDE